MIVSLSYSQKELPFNYWEKSSVLLCCSTFLAIKFRIFIISYYKIFEINFYTSIIIIV
jgi:hypothetical protein